MNKSSREEGLLYRASRKINKRDKIAVVATIGIAIAYVSIISINNLIYDNEIDAYFMIRNSLYGAPFIIFAGVFNQHIVRWCNRQRWMLDNPHNTSVMQMVISVLTAIACVTFAFYLFDPNEYDKFYETFSKSYFQISIMASIITNCFVLMLAKYIDQSKVMERQAKHIRDMESEIMRVKYQQLRAQVNPHFLFNSLNILVSLINSNPHKATEYTKQLAAVYRYLLANDDMEVVSLSEELKFVQQYAKILSIRYGEGIKIHLPNLTDIAVMSKRIIPTSIQVLIENAVKHNIISTIKPLVISVYIDNNNLVVSNTLAMRPVPADSTGLGLKGLKEKYKIITDEDVKISQTQTTFRVSVPLINHNEKNA